MLKVTYKLLWTYDIFRGLPLTQGCQNPVLEGSIHPGFLSYKAENSLHRDTWKRVFNLVDQKT